MKKKHLLKKLVALGMSLVFACSLPTVQASAKNGYYEGDMYAYSLLSSVETLKGLQGAETWDVYGGVSHSLWNIFLDDCIHPQDGSGGGVPYEFEGETFYLSTSNLLSAAKVCNTQGMTCNVVFLLRWNGSEETAFLVEEGSREPGHNYWLRRKGYAGLLALYSGTDVLSEPACRQLHPGQRGKYA